MRLRPPQLGSKLLATRIDDTYPGCDCYRVTKILLVHTWAKFMEITSLDIARAAETQ